MIHLIEEDGLKGVDGFLLCLWKVGEGIQRHFTIFPTSNFSKFCPAHFRAMLAFVGQVTFLGLMGACFLTTLIATFTPKWRSFLKEDDPDRVNAINSGMFICDNLDMGTCLSRKSTVDTIVSICLIFALLLEMCALGWAAASLLACFVQKLRKFLFYPLPGMAGGVILFLFLGILLFALKQQGEIEFDMNARVNQGAVIGYSFYVCCTSLVFALGSLAAGIWTAFFLEHDF